MLFIEPSAGVSPIVRFIEQATQPVDIEICYLSSQPVPTRIRRDHEYLYSSTDPTLAQALHRVFAADWSSRRAGPLARGVSRRLVLSPGSEPKLATIIDQPGPVEIELAELGDDPARLTAIRRKRAEARVMLPDRLSRNDRVDVESLRRDGVAISPFPVRPFYLHAKIIVGDRYDFIGSENDSRASLDLNREVGVVMTVPSHLASLRNSFKKYWNRADDLG